MTQRVLEWATARLREGEPVALASVISAQGSVPGKPGAHMALTAAEMFGTIGGAGLELKVLDRLALVASVSRSGQNGAGSQSRMT